MRQSEKARERLSREVGTIRKTHPGRLRFALAFPNTYFLGMSSLGFHAIYHLLNEREDTVCERVFLPDADELDKLSRSGSILTTLESTTPVRQFDFLAFSVPFEMDYPNVLKILALSGLRELSEERDARSPLVMAGGAAVTLNPEVLAPFVDLFLIGEAEEALPEVIQAVHSHPGASREELLESLSGIEGIYVPRFYKPKYEEDGMFRGMETSHGAPARVKRRWVRDLDRQGATSTILTPDTEFPNMILAELSRGCARGCRFCAAGHIYLPRRARSENALLGDIRRAKAEAAEALGAAPRVGLVSASVFDHPAALAVCRSLAAEGSRFSISSTRADTITPEIAHLLREAGQETLTIAPETGTERLRSIIAKGISDAQIMNAAGIAWEAGFRRLRLYFMVGLPNETDADIDGISGLVVRVARANRWERLVVSASCFVPKPWTPFQWAGMDDEKELRRKLDAIRLALKLEPRVQMAGESARESVVQGVLARGDRRLSEALVKVSRGAANWKAAFRTAGVDPSFYAQRVRDRDEVFPWDHLDMGITKTRLWLEYQRALKGSVS